MHEVETVEKAKEVLLNHWNVYNWKEVVVYIHVRFETYNDAGRWDSLRVVYRDKKGFEQSFINNVALQFEFLEQLIDWDINLKSSPTAPPELICVDFHVESVDNSNGHDKEMTSFDIFDDRKQLHDFMLDFIRKHP